MYGRGIVTGGVGDTRQHGVTTPPPRLLCPVWFEVDHSGQTHWERGVVRLRRGVPTSTSHTRPSTGEKSYQVRLRFVGWYTTNSPSREDQIPGGKIEDIYQVGT